MRRFWALGVTCRHFRCVFLWVLSISSAYANTNTENVDAVIQRAYEHRGEYEMPHQKQIEEAVSRSHELSQPYHQIALDAKAHADGLILNKYKLDQNSQSPSPVFIFVSFSMPDESLISYLEEAKRIHAQVVIRGLVDHSFKKTVSRMQSIVEKTQGGVVLDPRLFEKFEVSVVPEIVVLKDASHFSLDKPLSPEFYDSLTGNVSLEYALNLMAKEGDAQVSAQMALDQLRGSRHV